MYQSWTGHAHGPPRGECSTLVQWSLGTRARSWSWKSSQELKWAKTINIKFKWRQRIKVSWRKTTKNIKCCKRSQKLECYWGTIIVTQQLFAKKYKDQSSKRKDEFLRLMAHYESWLYLYKKNGVPFENNKRLLEYLKTKQNIEENLKEI